MALGLLLVLPTVLPLFVFHDPKLAPVTGVESASPENGQSTEAFYRPYLSVDAKSGKFWDQLRLQVESAPSTSSVGARRWLSAKHVPFILALSDFITCIGAGMTVKFFNLFFIQELTHDFKVPAVYGT